MPARKPIIGLSGGIASGKSHVAALFAKHGCLVLDADDAVRRAYLDPGVRSAVLARFGPRSFLPTGLPDRHYLGQLVFADPQARNDLEAIIHPFVAADRDQAMKHGANDPAVRAFVWDIPLLFEVNLHQKCDILVFIETTRQTRLSRAAARGWSETELARRESAQFPLDTKRARSQYVLRNNPSDAPTLDDQVKTILHQILGQNQPVI